MSEHCTCWKDEHYSLNQRMCAIHKDAQPEPEDALADELDKIYAEVNDEITGDEWARPIQRAAAALRAVSQPLTDGMIEAAGSDYFSESYAHGERKQSFTDGAKWARGFAVSQPTRLRMPDGTLFTDAILAEMEKDLLVEDRGEPDNAWVIRQALLLTRAVRALFGKSEAKP
jgi:hypothetical protein